MNRTQRVGNKASDVAVLFKSFCSRKIWTVLHPYNHRCVRHKQAAVPSVSTNAKITDRNHRVLGKLSLARRPFFINEAYTVHTQERGVKQLQTTDNKL